MCDTSSSHRSVSRRSLLGAAMAGTGAMLAGSIGAPPAAAAPQRPALGTPLNPVLPEFPAQPQGTLLTLLGTSGGPQAEYVRTGTSSVLTVGGVNYVVDAGRGSVTQYLNAGLTFASLRAMFLTHLHADHLADYYNYFLLEGGDKNAEGDALTGPLKVFGPGPAGGLPPKPDPSTPTINRPDPTPGIRTLTDRLNEGYAYSYNLFLRDSGTTDIRLKQKIHEIKVPDVGAVPVLYETAPRMAPFKVYEDDRVRVSAILVPHGWVFPSFAFRFDLDDGRSVVFSGDTTYSENVIELAQDADVLVHEVIDLQFIEQHGGGGNAQLLQHLKESHTPTDQVGLVAQQAGVPQLVLTHLVPSNPALIPDLMWKTKCGQGYFGDVHVGNDLDQLLIPTRRR